MTEKKKMGRPKGSLNKSTAEMKELAQAYGPRALKRLAQLMDEAEAEETRRGAANDLLNRGYGRPAQTQQLAGHDGGPLDLSTMSDEQLHAALLRLGVDADGK